MESSGCFHVCVVEIQEGKERSGVKESLFPFYWNLPVVQSVTAPETCSRQMAAAELHGLEHLFPVWFSFRLCHSGRPTLTLQTVISGKIFRLQAANGESELCPRFTASELQWDPRLQSGGIINEFLGAFPSFC